MGGHVTGADSAGTCSSSERVVMLLGLTLLAHGSSERGGHVTGADSAGTWQL